MKILVLNCGSSSVKYQLFDTETKKPDVKGIVERIGMASAIVRYNREGQQPYKVTQEILDHTIAIKKIIDLLTDNEIGVVGSLDEIEAVGHRVVHGGEAFSGSVLITPDVVAEMEKCVDLAPLHNPPNLKGIYACQRLMPTVPQVGVFDTAFHQTMPKKAWIYAIPYVLYKRHGIRRYGFHGTSHYYVAHRAAELIGRPISELKIITAHLGNGSSITAVEGGKSVDTSMGMTPLEGLVMGTRSGDIDPAVLLHVMGREELSLAEAQTMMNKHSGLYALSGFSNDMREIEEEAAKGHERAQLALDVFVHRLRKYVAGYAAVMGGVDAVVFTGGIGENGQIIREMTCEKMEFMGVHLNRAINNEIRAKEALISTEDSPVKVFVIPTAEELVIALDTHEIAAELKK